MAATLKIPTIFTAVDKFSSVVKTMTKSVSTFSQKSIASIQRFDQKINKTFQKLNGLAQLGIGLGVGAIFGEAIRGNIQFNDSLASVSAITGATGQDLIKLEKLAMNTAKIHKKSGSEVLKAYELIASAKPELLSNVDALDQVTKSVITLSKASRLDLETASLSLTNVMNQFNLGAEKSVEVVDAMAAGAKYGSAEIGGISDAILQFGTGAKSFNVNIVESIALVETFAAKGVKGAEAGTKLRNILTKMSAVEALPAKAVKAMAKYGVDTRIVSDKTIPLIDRLTELKKIAGNSAALVKVFGLENKEAGQILLENLPLLTQLTKDIGEKGVADIQAAANTNTLAFALESIKTSFLNATTATNGNSKSLERIKSILFGVGDNMETVIGVTGTLIGLYVAMKAILIIASIFTWGYNVALGVMGALSGTASIAIGKSAVALNAYKIATSAATAVNWLFNASNPVGWIMILIGLVALIITKYDKWGASLAFLIGPLGWIINLVQAFRRNWDMIKKSFSEGGFLSGLKAIGKVLLDSLLMPMQQLLEILSKIPGLGGLANSGAQMIQKMRQNLGVETGEKKQAQSSPEITSQQIVNEIIQKGSLTIDLNDRWNNVKSINQSGDLDIPINITKTQGAF